MKIGSPIIVTNLFDKTVDTSDVITEGTAQLFYPDVDKLKVADLPTAPNAYLEIPQTETPPPTPAEGDIYYDPVALKFYCYVATEWKECLFAVTLIPP